MLTLGHDRKTQEPVTLDASHARVVLICGKRGSGKSYTLGVLAEELFAQQPRPMLLLVDPMGIFWTMAQRGETPRGSGLRAVGSGQLPRALNPEPGAESGLPVTVLVPGEPTGRYPQPFLTHLQTLGAHVQRISFPPAALSSDAWCGLFELSINEPLGIALTRAITHLTEHQPAYALADLTEAIQHDALSQDRTKEALLNRLSMAQTWSVFEPHAPLLDELLTAETLNVLDLSTLDYSTHGLRSLVLALLAQQLFRARHVVRQTAEPDSPQPKCWLLIDEAHQFIPQGQSTLAKDALIRWVKEGRQPGLSCVLASQQPGSLDQDVLSQCDALIAHKLTNLEDVTALNRLSQAYMGSELKVYLRHLTGPGQAVLVDDARERVTMLHVRERLTRHGGGEA